MKEAFTKIKEAIANIHRVVKTDEDLEWNRAIYKCSTIVSEVEAEYGNDACEWKNEKGMFIQNPHTGRKFSNEPSMKNVYCNTCGKKIKVVDDTEAEYINKSTEYINKSGDCSTNWIDVKARLPEKDGYYLTCDHKGNIHVFYHHPSYLKNGSNMAFGICKNHPQFYKPIAWMELPKPYTRKKGELVCQKD